MSPSRSSPVPATASIVGLIFIAAGLRLWGLGMQLPLIDEANPVFALTQASFGWIRSHLGPLDHCIPLTLFDKFAVGHWGLDEWTLRLPSAVAGVLAVATVGAVSLRTLSPTEAILSTGAVTLSPYLVYLSREGRPYPIVGFLFLLATALAFDWARRGGRIKLLVATVAGVLAFWFHPIVLPAAAVLGVFVVLHLVRAGWRSKEGRDVLLATAVGAALAAYLIGPIAPSLVAQWVFKTGRGSIDAASIRNGLTLLHGGAITLPITLWLLVWAAAAFGLARRQHTKHRTEFIAIGAMMAVQFLFILQSQPTLSQTSWVWLRYCAHILPFALALSVLPLAWAIEWLCRRAGRSGLSAVVAALATFAALLGYAGSHRYALPPFAAYNGHPWLTFLPLQLAESPIGRVTPAFYSGLQASDEALIEVPMPTTFPIYGIYQRTHGRPIYAGIVEGGTWQPSFTVPGMKFRRIVNLKTRTPVLPADAGLLIFHKDIRSEMSLLYTAAGKVPKLSPHLYPQEALENFWILELGAEPMLLPKTIGERFPMTYEDEFIQVYDLRGQRHGESNEARGSGADAATP